MKFSLNEKKQIQTALDAHIPNNVSAEVVISVGESLLLLIDAANNAKLPQKVISKLKALYLNGIKTKDEQVLVTYVKQLYADRKQIQVSADFKVINQDPSRRYFESHLAYHVAKNTPESLDITQLRAFTDNLKEHLFLTLKSKRKSNEQIKLILEGKIHPKQNKYEQEYAELINQLQNYKYHGFSKAACDNLCEIAKSTIIATLITQYDDGLPANIYADSVFNFGVEGRGRNVKKDQKNVRTEVKGLMLSTSPLPSDDLVKTNTPSPFERSADQASFMEDSEWCQHLFGRQTHIYSNGISSTTLAQMRNILTQTRLEKSSPIAFLQAYMTSFATLMVFNSGGHSFFEIFEVFKLPVMQEIMQAAGCEQLVQQDKLMQQWLLKDQKEPFNLALSETIIYTKQLLNRRLMHAELLKPTVEQSDIETTQEISIHKALFTMNAKAFKKYLQVNVVKEGFNIDQRSTNKLTPLMLAAQAGKLAHVQLLLSFGANYKASLSFKDRNRPKVTALDLAIKSEKYPVVAQLLESLEYKVVKPGTSPYSLDRRALSNRAPALYFACRQFDMRILAEVCKDPNLQFMDIANAIDQAIKFENIEAVIQLTGYLNIASVGPLRFKFLSHTLIKRAVLTGNVRLVTTLLESPITVDHSSAFYEALLSKALDKKFLPVSKLLLSHARDHDALPSKKNLNRLMLHALENKDYDTAILAIAYGANPDAIQFKEQYLKEFTKYLRNKKPEYFDVFFTPEDKAMIAARSAELQDQYSWRAESLWGRFMHLLVAFLNNLPLVNLGDYYYKTEVMERLAFQVVTTEPKADEDLVYSPNPYETQEVYGAANTLNPNATPVLLSKSMHSFYAHKSSSHYSDNYSCSDDDLESSTASSYGNY